MHYKLVKFYGNCIPGTRKSIRHVCEENASHVDRAIDVVYLRNLFKQGLQPSAAVVESKPPGENFTWHLDCPLIPSADSSESERKSPAGVARPLDSVLHVVPRLCSILEKRRMGRHRRKKKNEDGGRTLE